MPKLWILQKLLKIPKSHPVFSQNIGATLIPAKGNYVSDNWYIFKNNVIQYRKYHKRIQSPFLFDVSQERVLVFFIEITRFHFWNCRLFLFLFHTTSPPFCTFFFCYRYYTKNISFIHFQFCHLVSNICTYCSYK